MAKQISNMADDSLLELEDGSEMFSCCMSLTSWDGDFPKLSDGREMFESCCSLRSFAGRLPELANGHEMFYSTALSSWDVALPELTDGRWMFDDCGALDAASIAHIVDSLPAYEEGLHEISFVNVPALKRAHIKRAAAKGWTLILR